MKKLLVSLLFFLPFLSIGQSWVLRENILKFPVGFESWIKKHNGGVDTKDKNLGTNQGVEIVDFNKDGRNDLIMQITPSNEVTREYIRGIFIRDAYGNFNLDTNYVIKGKGDIWYGGAGDFNGDGLTDYHYLTQNYHGQDSLRNYSPEMVRDDWPDRVFINNGSKFDTLSLDKNSYTIKSSFVADLNNDGRDEIVTTSKDLPNSVVVYSYNSILKKFERVYDSITQFWKNKLIGNPGPEPVFNIGNYNSSSKWALTYRDSPASQNDGNNYNFRKFNFSQFDPKSLVNKEILWERNERLISKSVSISDKDDYFKFNLSNVPSAFELDLNLDGLPEYVASGFYSTNTELGPSKFAYGLQVFDNQGKEVTSTYLSGGGYDDNVDLYLSSLDIDANYNGNEIIPCAWGVRLGDISYYYVRKDNKLQKQFISIVSPSGVAIASKTLTAKALIALPNPNGINGLLLYDFQDLKSTSVITYEDCITTIPKITTSGSTTFCAGGKVTLTASDSRSYLWSNGSTTQSIQVSDAGAYSVSVTNQKCSTALNSSTVTVVVTTIPNIPTITNTTPLTFCTGQNVVLTSNGTGNQWYLNDAIISNANSNTITVTASGVYKVRSINGDCSSAISSPATVVVNTIPSTPSITATTPLTFCAGQNVVLTSSSTNNQWYLNGNVINNASTATLTANASGTYQVKAINGDCGSPLSSATTVVLIPIPPTPSITIEANGGLTSSASDGNQWYFNDVKIDNATQKTINPTQSGNYTVRVITPCTSDLSKPYNLVVTATEETILGQVSVSPNPVTSQFKVSFPVEFGKTAQVKIVDMAGNIRYKKLSVNDGDQIDLGVLNGGNYILHIQSNDNLNLKTIKISKIQ